MSQSSTVSRIFSVNWSGSIPRELLLPEGSAWPEVIHSRQGVRWQAPWHFDATSAQALLTRQFGTHDSGRLWL